jgi:predicted dehydrogenase
MAKKHKIANSTTDYQEILNDQEIDLVLIATQHHMHAKMAIEAIKAGKSIFVEKPLALNKRELDKIIENYNSKDVNVSVGFNRRFAPLTKKMKKVLGSSTTPVNIIATMNAGFIPKDVWVHDMEIGGGRIIGEACHYIDLCSYLTGSKVISVCMNAMGVNPEENTDNASILLKYENGSNAVINYFSNGSKSYFKERVEVYSQERTLVMDNWRKLKGYGFKGFSSAKSSQDKGHFNQFQALVTQQKNGGKAIIPFDEIVNTTRASFAAIDSLKEGKWISIK